MRLILNSLLSLSPPSLHSLTLHAVARGHDELWSLTTPEVQQSVSSRFQQQKLRTPPHPSTINYTWSAAVYGGIYEPKSQQWRIITAHLCRDVSCILLRLLARSPASININTDDLETPVRVYINILISIVNVLLIPPEECSYAGVEWRPVLDGRF